MRPKVKRKAERLFASAVILLLSTAAAYAQATSRMIPFSGLQTNPMPRTTVNGGGASQGQTSGDGPMYRIFASAPASESFPNGQILDIDFLSGAVINTLPGPDGFIIGDGFSGLTFADSRGTLYVVDGLGTNRIFELDPATGAVLNSFPSPTGSWTLDGLAFLNDTLFGIVYGGGEIIMIDPDTGAHLGALTSVGGSAIGGLDGAAGRLFSRGASNTTIVEIDPVFGTLLNSFSSPDNEAIFGLAFDGASLFASSSTGKVFQLDPDTGTLINTLEFGTVLDGLAIAPILVAPRPSRRPS